MHKRRWFVFGAVAAPALILMACGGDDASDFYLDGSAGAPVGGAGGAAGGKAGAGGSSGSVGSGGSAGTAKDGGTGSGAGSAGTAGTGGSAGTAGTGGSGAGGTSIDAGNDRTTVIDAATDGMGGARPDTGGDASAPDAGPACMMGPATGMTCTDYCGAWFTTCQPIAMWSTTYATRAACMSACAPWNDAKLCCRAEHVHNAVVAPNANQAERHCGHAVGVDGPPPCAD
jgi:hypothetical protein